ncbi:MAG: ATP-binding cassette domain-containing protein [Clostridia bacterium]|nr:ATP-binding cassette domain-containing protein [Clostridia bacterium]
MADIQNNPPLAQEVDEKGNLPLVSVRNLSVHFPVGGGFLFGKKKTVKAVSDISLDIYPGETYGLVGESGCGKSTLANTMLGMITPTEGTVYFKGKDLFGVDKKTFTEMRRGMQMIFQDPYSSLNPRFDVLQIIGEPLKIRGGYTDEEIEARVLELLRLVGLSDKDLHRHPSDFSGGQRQRIGIARAIILNPDFLVCDEPVSALDVSVHAQILNLLMKLQKEIGMTYLFISHNLAVVKTICTHMTVMYLGKMMESGKTESIYKNPMHPYTQALLSAVLDIDVDNKKERTILKGDIPSPIDPPIGCRFCQRCPKAMEKCKYIQPETVEVEPGHFVACHLCSGERV